MSNQQPGNWPDPSWPSGQQPSGPPASPAGYPSYQDPYLAQQQSPAYPGYGYQTPPPPVIPAPSTNGLAIASLICSIAGILTCGATSLVGAILGHVAQRQIARRQQAGNGIALAGIITGWIVTALWTIFWIIAVIGIVAARNAGAGAS